MSNDIFYTNISNLVTFYMGERPSADKFNAVNKYFSRGMRELAGAIGDIYDDGFPYIGARGELGPKWNVSGAEKEYKRLLDIVSLGRLIGPASNLNSRMHLSYGTDEESITETIPVGSVSYKLLHPYNSGGLTIPQYSRVDNFINPYFTETNEYKIINEREIIFSAPTDIELTVTYTTAPNEYFGGVDYENAGFNVIPDPNQTQGVQIEELENGKYKISFPGILQQQSGLLNLKDSDISADHDFNNAKDYELPKWLIDSITDNDGNIIDENRIIPGNFLYLKNRRTQEVYKDAIYEYESPTSIIVSNIDLCVEEDGDYSSSDYCVILTGTNITNLLDDLRLKWFKHSHDGSFGESLIQFKSLVGKFVDTPPSGIYGPSRNAWNQMPMYLHRDGYSADANLNNGNNAMRGPLAMGLMQFNPLDPAVSSIISGDANSGSSYPIFFGSELCSIQRAGLNLAISQGLVANLILTSNQDISISAVRDVDVFGVDIKVEASNYISLQDDDFQKYLEVYVDEKKLKLNNTIEITKFSPESLSPEGVTEDFQFGNLQRTNYEVERNASTWSKDIDTTKIVFDSDYFETDEIQIDVTEDNHWEVNTANGSFYITYKANPIFRGSDGSGGLTYGAPISWGDEDVESYFADPYNNNVGSIWKWWGLSTSGAKQEFRDILFQKDWISAEEKETLGNAASGGRAIELERTGSWLSVCNHRSLNCSYDIDLYARKHLVLNEDGSTSRTQEPVDVMHARHRVHPTNAYPYYTNETIGYQNYTEIEINRFLPLKRALVFNDTSKEYKNTFYFRINLPEKYWWPLRNNNQEGRNFSRFLVAFEYGGRKVNGTNEYVSNNFFGSGRGGTIIYDEIQDIKVTVNGFSLGGTRDIHPDSFELLKMGKQLYGPNDATFNHTGDSANASHTGAYFLRPNLYPVGQRYHAPGFFEGGVYGLPFDASGHEGVGLRDRSELIINEYKKDRFITNLFRANTTYKVEETIHNGHVWLKITG